MGDMAEDFKLMKQGKKAANARRKTRNTHRLVLAGVQFESKNDGSHLIIAIGIDRISFWPGSGKWNVTGSTKYHQDTNALFTLIKGLKDGKDSTR